MSTLISDFETASQSLPKKNDLKNKCLKSDLPQETKKIKAEPKKETISFINNAFNCNKIPNDYKVFAKEVYDYSGLCYDADIDMSQLNYPEPSDFPAFINVTIKNFNFSSYSLNLLRKMSWLNFFSDFYEDSTITHMMNNFKNNHNIETFLKNINMKFVVIKQLNYIEFENLVKEMVINLAYALYFYDNFFKNTKNSKANHYYFQISTNYMRNLLKWNFFIDNNDAYEKLYHFCFFMFATYVQTGHSFWYLLKNYYSHQDTPKTKILFLYNLFFVDCQYISTNWLKIVANADPKSTQKLFCMANILDYPQLLFESKWKNFTHYLLKHEKLIYVFYWLLYSNTINNANDVLSFYEFIWNKTNDVEKSFYCHSFFLKKVSRILAYYKDVKFGNFESWNHLQFLYSYVFYEFAFLYLKYDIEEVVTGNMVIDCAILGIKFKINRLYSNNIPNHQFLPTHFSMLYNQVEKKQNILDKQISNSIDLFFTKNTQSLDLKTIGDGLCKIFEIIVEKKKKLEEIRSEFICVLQYLHSSCTTKSVIRKLKELTELDNKVTNLEQLKNFFNIKGN